MQIEIADIELCADELTYSCVASFAGIAFSDFAVLLKGIGFKTVTLPTRGTVIGRRDATMLLVEPSGRFTLSRLTSREQAERIVQELVRHQQRRLP
jgi:hypothetical protein